MTWTHAVLEIYEPDDGWPTEGTPADWIADSKVGYANGDAENLVYFIPIRHLLWWKLKGHGRDLRNSLEYLWGFVTGENKRLEKEFEKWLDEMEISEEDIKGR
jgi:hypothetical protein